VDSHRHSTPDVDGTPQTLSPDGQSGTVDLCHMTWDGVMVVLNGTAASEPSPGPQPGRLDLTRTFGWGCQVTQFTPC